MIPFTQKEILALPAGPELDALVAEHVMGLTILGWWKGTWIEGEWMPDRSADESDDLHTPWFRQRLALIVPFYDDGRCACSILPSEEKTFFGHHETCPAPVPSYSTDPAAAWKVVCKMSQEYYWHAHGLVDDRVSFQFTKEDCGDCPAGHTAVGHVNNGMDEWHWPADGESMSLAICRAALSALKVHEKPYTVAHFYGHP